VNFKSSSINKQFQTFSYFIHGISTIWGQIMERNTNTLTISVNLIFLLLLVFFLFRFIFASPVGNFGSSIIYEQKSICKDSNVEVVEGPASADVLV